MTKTNKENAETRKIDVDELVLLDAQRMDEDVLPDAQKISDDTELTVPSTEECHSGKTTMPSELDNTAEKGEVTPKGGAIFDDQVALAEPLEVEVVPVITDSGESTAPSIRDQILAARKTPEQMASALATRTEQFSVPVYKRLPDSVFWRVRAGGEWDATASEVLLLPRKDGGGGPEFLLVPPRLEPLFNDDARLRNLVSYHHLAFVVDARGHAGWWAVPSQSDNSWHISVRAAMRSLETEWGMLKSDMGAKAYKLEKPMDDLGDPLWPSGSHADWFVKGFSDKLIDSAEHPVLMELQGRKQ